jgi:hypothetical protein
MKGLFLLLLMITNTFGSGVDLYSSAVNEEVTVKLGKNEIIYGTGSYNAVKLIPYVNLLSVRLDFYYNQILKKYNIDLYILALKSNDNAHNLIELNENNKVSAGPATFDYLINKKEVFDYKKTKVIKAEFEQNLGSKILTVTHKFHGLFGNGEHKLEHYFSFTDSRLIYYFANNDNDNNNNFYEVIKNLVMASSSGLIASPNEYEQVFYGIDNERKHEFGIVIPLTFDKIKNIQETLTNKDMYNIQVEVGEKNYFISQVAMRDYKIAELLEKFKAYKKAKARDQAHKLPEVKSLNINKITKDSDNVDFEPQNTSRLAASSRSHSRSIVTTTSTDLSEKSEAERENNFGEPNDLIRTTKRSDSLVGLILRATGGRAREDSLLKSSEKEEDKQTETKPSLAISGKSKKEVLTSRSKQKFPRSLTLGDGPLDTYEIAYVNTQDDRLKKQGTNGNIIRSWFVQTPREGQEQ